MAEDKKKRSGLHKKISSIFEGVPLPQPGSLQQPLPASGGPSPDQAAGNPQRPLPPPFQTLRLPQTSRPYEAGQPEAASVSQHKAGAAVKTSGLWQQVKNKLFAPKPGVSATRQKVMVVLVPLLIIVLIFVITSVMAPSQKAPRPPKDKLLTTTTTTTTDIASNTEIEWQIPPPYPTTLRDPMKPAPSTTIPGQTTPETVGVEVVKPQKFVVKGILYSEDNPSAIIGTQIFHKGDKVSGATVVQINKDGVEFEMDGKKWKQGVEP